MENENFLDYNGLCQYDARIKEYIDQRIYLRDFDLTKDKLPQGLVVMMGSYDAISQSWKIIDVVMFNNPKVSDYKVTLNVVKCNYGTVLTPQDAEPLKVFSGEISFTMFGKRNFFFSLNDYCYFSSMRIEEVYKPSSKLSEMKNDIGFVVVEIDEKRESAIINKPNQ